MIETLAKAPSMIGIYRRALLKKRDPRYTLGDALPELGLRLESVAIDGKHLARYNAVCGFNQGEFLPATYPQILAFPLQLFMLTDKKFPFPLLGLVHLANRIDVLQPISRKAKLTIDVAIGEQRVVSNGVEVDVDTTIKADGELAWRGVATMLHRCRTDVAKDSDDNTGKKNTGGNQATALRQNRQAWSLAANLGRRYGRASGDINPIHLTVATAKAFGFKRAIAHGMWSKARCLSALDGKLPAAPYRVDVRFKRPIFLPAQVQFFHQRDAGDHHTIQFELWNKTGEQPHLSGSVTDLSK